MKHSALLVSLVIAPFALTGCVERKFVVTSNPPGAFVQLNGQVVGPTPADISFDYYGDYDITLTKDGFETLKVHQPMKAPWYEYPPLDFISENLIPWRIKDVRCLPVYQMQPQQVPSVADVVARGTVLQQRAENIGTPPAPQPIVTPPAPQPPVVTPPPVAPGDTSPPPVAPGG